MRDRLNKEYNNAFNAVKSDEFAEVAALYVLACAIKNKDYQLLRRYIIRLAPVEAQRYERNIRQVLESLGEATRAPSEAEKKDDLLNAMRGLLRRTKYPLSELARKLNARLKKARFVLWWDERSKRLVPGLYCETMETALAALLFSRFASPEAIAICARCGNTFIRKKRMQRFCSLRCGNADRKARQRAAQDGKGEKA
jgi:hypothetical protein